MNKTINDVRDEFYEKIIKHDRQEVILKEDVLKLLNDMRDITIDWAINNAVCHKIYGDTGYNITQQEYIEIYKPSLLEGKTIKDLKI